MLSQNVLSPDSQGPRSPELGSVLNQNEGTPLKNSRDISIAWSREKLKPSYFFNHRAVEMYKQILCLSKINTEMSTEC